MTPEEVSLIRAGVRRTIDTLERGLHSEDNHGADLVKWLSSREEQIVADACARVCTGRAMLVD